MRVRINRADSSHSTLGLDFWGRRVQSTHALDTCLMLHERGDVRWFRELGSKRENHCSREVQYLLSSDEAPDDDNRSKTCDIQHRMET